jgi:hypothetical protein
VHMRRRRSKARRPGPDHNVIKGDGFPARNPSNQFVLKM